MGIGGAQPAGTDASIGSTVRVRVRHVIDRGGGCTVRKASCPSLSVRKVSPTKDCNKEQRESVRGTVAREKRKIVVQDARS